LLYSLWLVAPTLLIWLFSVVGFHTVAVARFFRSSFFPHYVAAFTRSWFTLPRSRLVCLLPHSSHLPHTWLDTFSLVLTVYYLPLTVRVRVLGSLSSHGYAHVCHTIFATYRLLVYALPHVLPRTHCTFAVFSRSTRYTHFTVPPVITAFLSVGLFGFWFIKFNTHTTHSALDLAAV